MSHIISSHMTLKHFPLKYLIIAVLILCAIALPIYFFRVPLWEKICFYYNIFAERDRVKTFIASFGRGAPAAFMIMQVLQVLFAPIPGEVSGFIGGYLFGAIKGFIYSSISLAAGSWINFAIGRFLGRRYVKKIVPADKLRKYDTLIKHQGIIVIFVLFLFPGFPKDYLCFFLGLSGISHKIFIILSSIGRMPGTFMLSLQGAFLFDRMYGLFAIVSVFCLILVFIACKYREKLYRLMERINGND